MLEGIPSSPRPPIWVCFGVLRMGKGRGGVETCQTHHISVSDMSWMGGKAPNTFIVSSMGEGQGEVGVGSRHVKHAQYGVFDVSRWEGRCQKGSQNMKEMPWTCPSCSGGGM